MRKLKFKIWNKRENEWHRFTTSLALDVNGESVYYLGMDWETELDPLTVVQFVNVYDMHGKEVYEGGYS